MFQEKKSPSEIIADDLGINNVDIEYDEDDFITLNNYKLFKQHVQPLLQKANPKVAMSKMVTLIGAKWREFASLVAAKHKKDDSSSPPKKEEEVKREDSDREEVADNSMQDIGKSTNSQGFFFYRKS